MDFPSRKEILEKEKTENKSYRDLIVDDIKSIDVNKVDFSGGFKPRVSMAEKQKVFIWIRVYLNEEENEITPNDIISITYLPSGEKLETKFICFAKKGLDKDSTDSVTNYSKEDDKKVLCLMVDTDRIVANSEDIPYIRTLFPGERYFQFQLIKRGELIFTNESSGKKFEYYDISF